MNKITCKIGDLFKAIENLSQKKVEVENFYKVDDSHLLRIKNEKNDFIKIKNLLLKNGKKTKLSFENDLVLNCSDTHKICVNKENGEYVLTKDLKIGDLVETVNGKTKISNVEVSNINDVFYDMEVDSDLHLYQTSNGLVHHNCGKSDMIEKMAKAYEIPCVRINFSSGTSEGDLLGKFVIKNGETVFADGYIPLAMKNGWWVILDEVDYAQPEHISCLQAVLEGKALVNIKNEGEIVDPHARFRVFATANTKGRGDMTDSYNGTNFLNIAFLDRWTIFEMNYTKKEKDIAKAIIGDDIMAGKLIDLFNLLRQSVKNNDLNNASFSTRRLIQTCEALKMGDSLNDSIQYEILNRYHEEEVNIITEYINDVFDNTFYIKGNWKLGMDHFKPQQTVEGNVQTDNSMKDII